jgi:3-phosphoshikimate 1-carboxyvinyltransferase
MGAEVSTQSGGRPPIKIRGGSLRGISVKPDVASAQLKSASILAGLYAQGDTVYHEPLQTRDHTERLLQSIAPKGLVNVDRIVRSITVYGENLPLPVFDLVVPGDASSAAYPVVLATMLPESTCTIPFVGLNPGRIAFYRHLQAMGAHIVMTREEPHTGHATCGEPVGEITVMSSRLKNVPLDPERIPALIDEIPLLSVIACLSERPWEISGAARLREKETDRITTTSLMLRSLGAEVTEHRDGLSGEGNQRYRGGVVDSMGDHRIAMSAAVAGWLAQEPVRIVDSDCVSISFPAFFEKMADVVEYH